MLTSTHVIHASDMVVLGGLGDAVLRVLFPFQAVLPNHFGISPHVFCSLSPPFFSYWWVFCDMFKMIGETWATVTSTRDFTTHCVGYFQASAQGREEIIQNDQVCVWWFVRWLMWMFFFFLCAQQCEIFICTWVREIYFYFYELVWGYAHVWWPIYIRIFATVIVLG